MKHQVQTTVAALTVAALATIASAVEFSGSFGWEDGSSTIFGQFPSGLATSANVTSGSETDYGASGGPAVYIVLPSEGSQMLQVTELDTTGSNPNVIIGWIDGLVDGDTFSFSFDGFDPSDGRSPSLLPSAIYTNGDATSFAGFASPFQDFEDYPGTAWLTYQADAVEGVGIQPTFTFDAGTDRTGVALRAQLFAPSASQPSNGGPGTYEFFIDNLQVTVDSSSPNARIVFADGSEVLVPEPSSLALLGLGGLLVVRRRRG